MKKDLKYNKWGSIVSKKKSEEAKKGKRLEKAGWTAKKGKFGAVRIADAKKSGAASPRPTSIADAKKTAKNA